MNTEQDPPRAMTLAEVKELLSDPSALDREPRLAKMDPERVHAWCVRQFELGAVVGTLRDLVNHCLLALLAIGLTAGAAHADWTPTCAENVTRSYFQYVYALAGVNLTCAKYAENPHVWHCSFGQAGGGSNLLDLYMSSVNTAQNRTDPHYRPGYFSPNPPPAWQNQPDLLCTCNQSCVAW